MPSPVVDPYGPKVEYSRGEPHVRPAELGFSKVQAVNLFIPDQITKRFS
jgi:hypothetical protein